MHVTYHNHSGFSVDTGERVLLFDYIGGGFKKPGKPCLALVSHAHSDHWMQGVEQLADACVGGFDLPDVPGIARLNPGDLWESDGVRVRAYRSTDEGVSFAVSCDGLRIFHAGDLNFWHWREDGDEEYTRDMLAAFDAALNEMEGEEFDLTFFPVDARLGAGHDEGAEMFLSRIRTKVFIPMHCTSPESAREFEAKHAGETGFSVRAMTAPGETIQI